MPRTIPVAVLVALAIVLVLAAIAYAQPVLPTEPKVKAVELVAETGTITLGSKARFRITLYFSEPAPVSTTLTVKLTCMLGNENVSSYVGVPVKANTLSASARTELLLSKTGTWVCTVSYRDLVSSPVVVKVVSPEAALMARLSELVLIIAAIAILVVMAALLYLRRRAYAWIR